LRFVYEMFERKLCDEGIIAAASSPTECGTGTGSIMGFGGSSDNSKIKEKSLSLNIIFWSWSTWILYFCPSNSTYPRGAALSKQYNIIKYSHQDKGSVLSTFHDLNT